MGKGLRRLLCSPLAGEALVAAPYTSRENRASVRCGRLIHDIIAIFMVLYSASAGRFLTCVVQDSHC